MPYKVTLQVDQALHDRMLKLEKLAAQYGYEFDVSAGLVDSLVMQVARAENLLRDNGASA
ncbi:hypothetical protein SAMN04488038_104203 [Solimonas aquatica]|uniref:Uncharacterized protein n=1 Tax=Solimonas aquatica TaxID=489703 RepID=A0A1H9DXX8_9GAMM|nr:hypothetical protein SAMN04488038_104203 [Solimonas aquatica]